MWDNGGMWKRIRRAWDTYRHLRAFRDLLEGITLWKLFLLGVSMLTGLGFTLWSWMTQLPKPLAALIGLGAATLAMGLLSFGIKSWRNWKQEGPRDATEIDAVPSRRPPGWVMVVIGSVMVCIAIGWFVNWRKSTAPPLTGPTPEPRKTVQPNADKRDDPAKEKRAPRPATAPSARPTGPSVYAPGGVVSVGQQGGITAKEVNINPAPRVLASPQTQRQTGDPQMPWSTIFSIRATGLVVTGDLKLKCTGPVIKASVGRINPSSLITGSNGPDPIDPTVVV